MIPGPWISLFYAKAMISKEEWQTHSLVFSKTHSRKVPFSGTTSVKIFRWTWTLGNSRICPSPLFPITRLVCGLLAQLKLGAGSRGQAEGPQTRLLVPHPPPCSTCSSFQWPSSRRAPPPPSLPSQWTALIGMSHPTWQKWVVFKGSREIWQL